MTSASVERARSLTETEISRLAADLQRGLSGTVRDERHYRLMYATDASIYQMEPVAVVFPREAADVQHVLDVAGRWGVPVLPRGGGTSLAGQAVNHAVVLDFTPHMNDVAEVNVEAGWARAQPGAVLAKLNFLAGKHGLRYGIDPSTANRATVGGGIANNSCGAHSVIYGKTIDQVLSLDVVLADGSRAVCERVAGKELQEKIDLPGLEGAVYRELRRVAVEARDEVERRFPRILRRVSGYNLDELLDPASMDLSRLITGSEGTLAVVTEAKVRLVPLPAAKGLAAVHFESVAEACEGTLAALEQGPSAVELVDSLIIRRCRESAGYRRLAGFVEGDPGALLLVEFYGDSAAEVAARLARLAAGFRGRRPGYATVVTTDAAGQRDMWRMREAGLGLLMSVKGDTKPVAFVEDTAVSPDRLPAFVRRFQAITAEHGAEVAYYGHASVGCLHIRPMVNVKSGTELRAMEDIASRVADLVLEFGGSLSGEHGDGILRGVFTERMFGPRLTAAFREVKRAFDPQGILNPGKIVDTPPFAENLRLSPATRSLELGTYLDFGADGGMAGAAEQCNGQGACRKMEGAMCPSYMVTLDEEHSTRGRANLLRLVLDGALPAAELTGRALYEALDLCVECKACKAECPSGVDLAKLKYEVLTRFHEAKGTPLRARLFAHINLLSRIGSHAPWLGRFFDAQYWFRQRLELYLGIAYKRPLPRLASETFPRWFGGYSRQVRAPAPRGDAVYFHDTFTDYYHPEAGRAAVRVLEALGYRVILVSKTACCGRPAISKGMLGTAREWARRNVRLLAPYAERGVPIVGTEPSCLLTLRDEYPDLLRDEASRAVARQAFLIDELIARLAAEDATASSIFASGPERRILLHAHCHQKALAGVEPTLAMLGLVPGYKVELIDSGCCGMAGSFGFEAEHYEISRAMGALRLFPAVEAAAPATEIAITGVSCRQQIAHFTSRAPRHAIELLAEALA